nr:MAG TPA: hypothetical protein [Caudoviricetes sp.]
MIFAVKVGKNYGQRSANCFVPLRTVSENIL